MNLLSKIKAVAATRKPLTVAAIAALTVASAGVGVAVGRATVSQTAVPGANVVQFPAGFCTSYTILDGSTPICPTSTTSPATTTVSTSAPSTSATSPPSTSPTTTTTTTLAPTTTVAASTSTTAPSAPGCGLPSPAFCETFDSPKGNGSKTGDLDPVLWGVNRAVGQWNTGGHSFDAIPTATTSTCGAQAAMPQDVRICNGQLLDTFNDGGDVGSLDMYPKQPFNFAGRTGTVVFDISNDSQGPHAAWPEFVISDKPVPGLISDPSGGYPATAPNEVGFVMDGCDNFPSMVSVNKIFTSRSYAYASVPFTHDGCVLKGSPAALNHIKVLVSVNSIEIWGTDGGGSTLVKLAHANFATALGFAQGLVWLDDVHYNARKALLFGATADQSTHTFVWDNLGFDGPKTYRDLGFDVANGTTAGPKSENGDVTVNTGLRVGTTPTTLTVNGEATVQPPTGAQIVLNQYAYVAETLSVSVNGNPFIDVPWPYGTAPGFGIKALTIPVPLTQIVNGTNTLVFKSSDNNTMLANVSLIMVAGAPVP